MNKQPNTTDLSFLSEFTKNDQVKMKRYIEMYLKSAPSIIDEFEKELGDRNLESLRLKAHSIKPQAQYMGIVSLKNILLEIETLCKNGDSNNQLPGLVKEAKIISGKATKELQFYLLDS